MILPEMIAGCHGDEKPEVYTGKLLLYKVFLRLCLEPGAAEIRSAPIYLTFFLDFSILDSTVNYTR